VLLCEAKCSHDHRPASIAEGHEALSKVTMLQIEFFRILEALRDRGRANDAEWIRAIEAFRDSDDARSERKHDVFCYTCGRAPVIKQTWIDPLNKHVNYTSTAKLVAVEMYLNGIAGFIDELYGEAFVDAAS
jgi:Fe2+ or Zn2+ uptake regulation protein